MEGKAKIGWTAVAMTFLIIASIGGYFYRIAQNTSISKRVKLFHCTNQTLSTDFTVPKGSLFHLVLGGATSFSGKATVHDGANLVDEFEFSDATAMQCNWLDSRGYLNAKILNWKTHDPIPLKAGSTVQFNVTFTALPPTNAAIWLSYVQRYGDKKKL